MSDDDSGLQVRQTPRKRTGEAQIADFTTLVRVPGQPAAVRVYTDAEQDEGARYASEVGGVVVPLPLSPPAGFTPGRYVVAGKVHVTSISPDDLGE